MRRAHAPRVLTALALTGVLALAACTSPRPDAGEGADSSASPEESASSSETSSPTDDETSASPDGGDDESATDGPIDPDGDAEITDGGLESVRGLPNGVEAPLDTPGGVGWNEAGDALLVVTFGSSSCPLVPEGLTEGDSMVEIPLVASGGAVCTMDYVPTVTTLPAPAGLDPASAVTAQLGDLGQVTVPAAATPPAMGWLPAPEAP